MAAICAGTRSRPRQLEVLQADVTKLELDAIANTAPIGCYGSIAGLDR